MTKPAPLPPPRRELFAARPQNALLAFLLLALAWEAAGTYAARPSPLFPVPSSILAALYASVVSGDLFQYLLPTLGRLFAGFFAGAAAGAAVGLLCGARRFADSVLDPFISAAYPIPKAALIPVLLLAFGFGNALIVVLAAVAAFFPVAVTVRAGYFRVDRSLVDAARNMGAGRARIVCDVVLPSVTPYLLAGARLGLLSAMQVVVVAEMLLSAKGVGRMLWLSGEWLRMDVYYGYLAVLALTGIAAAWGLKKIAGKLAPWAVTDAG